MLEDLTKELNEVFDRQLQDLLLNRHIFQQLDEAWMRTASRPQAVELQNFMWQGYLAFACTAVRKMVDHKDKRSVSLWNFLANLKDPAALAAVSRSEYCKRYANEAIRERFADQHYHIVTGEQPDLTAEIIDKDIQQIQAAALPIKGIVDTVIAHNDRNQLAATMNDLNAAIDSMAGVYDRYAMLVGAHRTNQRELDELADVQADIVKIWP